jgi:gas vesicle protein
MWHPGYFFNYNMVQLNCERKIRVSDDNGNTVPQLNPEKLFIHGRLYINECTRRKTMAENDNRAIAGALMLVAGGIIGAGVALLFAPQSGDRTRKDIVRYGKKVRRKAEEVVDDFADTVSDLVETVSEKAEDLLDKGRDLSYEAKKELVKVIEEGQEKLEKQRAKLMKLVC